MKKQLISLISSLLVFLLLISPVSAARDNDSYDGNIYPIYAGNGSLVPPPSTLEESFKNKRTSVLVFYLDDSSTSKYFAPVVSGIKLLWSSSIDLIPLATDELQNKKTNSKIDPAYYWHGKIPQVVVIDGEGKILLDKEGQVPIEEINKAIGNATGLAQPSFQIKIKSYNEYNSEPSKKDYDKPRGT